MAIRSLLVCLQRLLSHPPLRASARGRGRPGRPIPGREMPGLPESQSCEPGAADIRLLSENRGGTPELLFQVVTSL